MSGVSYIPRVSPLSCIDPDFGLSSKDMSILLLANRPKNSRQTLRTLSRSNFQKKISYTLSPTKEQYPLESIDPQEESSLLQQVVDKLIQPQSSDRADLNVLVEINALKPIINEKKCAKLDEAPRLNYFRINLMGKLLFSSN